MHTVFTSFILLCIFFPMWTHFTPPEPFEANVFCAPLLCSVIIKFTAPPISVSPPSSPASRDKDLLPPPPLEHQNPPRPRSKPPSGKMAPRKEPRSATNPNNNAATPPAALQPSAAPAPAVTVNQVRLMSTRAAF